MPYLALTQILMKSPTISPYDIPAKYIVSNGFNGFKPFKQAFLVGQGPDVLCFNHV